MTAMTANLIDIEAGSLSELKPNVADKALKKARYSNRNVPDGQTFIGSADEYETNQKTTSSDEQLTKALRSTASFKVLQEWDGYVVSFGEDMLVARLTDITNAGKKDAGEIDIPFEELTSDQIARIEIGSLFRWSIGYQLSLAGQKTRVSRIVLRQLPRWRAPQMNAAEEEAKQIAQSLQWA